MLECVINVSEGRDRRLIDRIAGAAGDHLLDVHSDPHHHRSVLTMAGPEVVDRAFLVVAEACASIDLESHEGAHPRLGAADVVPFVPLRGDSMEGAVAARDRLARRVVEELGVPCFLYGPGRSLPDVRRRAFVTLLPDAGPPVPHPSAGAVCIGARPFLVAYNVWLAPPATIDDARRIAGAIRQDGLRTLGLQVNDRVQVSCNLVDPERIGPAVAHDLVAAHAGTSAVERCELVGLVPASVLAGIPARRWRELDVDSDRTIEARLERAGLGGS